MKDLILLHGALGSISSLLKIKEDLSKSFNCHDFNFSGHGSTSFNANGFGIEYFAEELEVFIQDKDLTEPHVFGYSMGGYVALYLAFQKPDLLGKIITLGTKFSWSPEAADEEVKKLNPELILKKVPKFAAHLEKQHGGQWQDLVWQTAGMMVELGEDPLITVESLNTIENEVLVLRGSKDAMVNDVESKWAVAHLPNGHFESLKNQPHPIEKVEKELLLQKIQNYL